MSPDQTILGTGRFVDLKGSNQKNYNFDYRWASLRQDQGHINDLLGPPPSPTTDQNIKQHKAPTPSLESAPWGSVNRLH